MSYPLRSLSPCPSKGYDLQARFNWLPRGEEPGEAEEEAIAFYDPLYNNYKTAFFLSLTRGSDPGGYMLYWEHIEPYLANFTQVYIAAYNHEKKAVTLQEYYEGEIDEEHDNISAEQWLSRLLLSSKEEKVFRQAE
jgi:hypothetical protein